MINYSDKKVLVCISMILGILGLVASCISMLGLLFSIPGLILGIKSKGYENRALVRTSIVINIVAVLIAPVLIIIVALYYYVI